MLYQQKTLRGKVEGFAGEEPSRQVAARAIEQGFDKSLDEVQKGFLYMPYMHSESQKIHELAVELFQQPGMENNYRYELRHKDIIDRFGRYPHRNKILGRQSSEEELAFLQQPGSGF